MKNTSNAHRESKVCKKQDLFERIQTVGDSSSSVNAALKAETKAPSKKQKKQSWQRKKEQRLQLMKKENLERAAETLMRDQKCKDVVSGKTAAGTAATLKPTAVRKIPANPQKLTSNNASLNKNKDAGALKESSEKARMVEQHLDAVISEAKLLSAGARAPDLSKPEALMESHLNAKFRLLRISDGHSYQCYHGVRGERHEIVRTPLYNTRSKIPVY